MKKLSENKASLALALFALTLVFTYDVKDLLAFFLLMIVSGTSLLIGMLLWDNPARKVILFDPETGEEGIGYPLRWLIRDLLLRFWNWVKVPVLVTVAFAGLTAFVLICLHRQGWISVAEISLFRAFAF